MELFLIIAGILMISHVMIAYAAYGIGARNEARWWLSRTDGVWTETGPNYSRVLKQDNAAWKRP